MMNSVYKGRMVPPKRQQKPTIPPTNPNYHPNKHQAPRQAPRNPRRGEQANRPPSTTKQTKTRKPRFRLYLPTRPQGKTPKEPTIPNSKITIDLNPDEAALIDRLIHERGYASADEVAREALGLLREKDRAMEKWLREEVLPVYERIKSGEERAIPLEEVFADLWEHHEKCKAAHQRKEAARVAAEAAQTLEPAAQ